MTKPITKEPTDGEKRPAKPIDYDSCDSILASDVLVAMPLSHTWRYAAPCPESPGILMSIPKTTDKKQENAEIASEYYRTHGNPNRGGKLIFLKLFDTHCVFIPRSEYLIVFVSSVNLRWYFDKKDLSTENKKSEPFTDFQ